MSCKDAIEILKQLLDSFTQKNRYTEPLKLAITALEIQDGNLYIRDVPGSLSIGVVRGNVFMGDYGE